MFLIPEYRRKWRFCKQKNEGEFNNFGVYIEQF